MIDAGAIFDNEGVAYLGRGLVLARVPDGRYVLSGTHSVALTQDELYNLGLVLARLSDDPAAPRSAP